MISLKPVLLTVAALLAASSAFAVIVIDTSYVDNVGNNADSSNNYGAVNYGYNVGRYEVTNSQYVSFLNAKAATDTHALYNTNMNGDEHGGILRSGSSGSFSYSVKLGFKNKPVNYVSFWDAARFTNWLTNGQGSGDTESGMYNLGGVTNPMNGSVTRQLDFSAGQNGVAVASEDEWYKAAYYDPNLNSDGGYWDYANKSNSIRTADANYANSVGTGALTVVGAYSGSSHYGTFDQSGNVWEWNDATVGPSTRGLRGGAFGSPGGLLQSSIRASTNPTNENNTIGFRVSSLAPIPEPSSYAAMFGCLALACATIRRKGRCTL